MTILGGERMSRSLVATLIELGPNIGYPQFGVVLAQTLGWGWVVGNKFPKSSSEYHNFTLIYSQNCGKIGVQLVLCLWLGTVLHIYFDIY